MTRTRIYRLATSALMATLAAASGQAALAASSSDIALPERGVVCDPMAQGGPTCYDANGITVQATRRYYGSPEAERLIRRYSGRPMPKEFNLSNGVTCNATRQRCWRVDNRGRETAERMARQLYGDGQASGSPVVTESNALCNITRNDLRVYEGGCVLKKLVGSNERRYVVTTNDNRRYSFQKNGNQFTVSDATGTWPARYQDQGRTGIFRWEKIKLTATRRSSSSYGKPNGYPYGYPYGSGGNAPYNRNADQFLDELFQ
jgi:hypothetical protein